MLRPLAALAMLFLAALLAGGVGARQASEIAVGDIYFNPKAATVAAGSTVTWRHEGVLPHTVTADDGSFDSGTGSDDWLRTDDTFSFTFTQPGTFPYHCVIHGGPGGSGQSGTITVVAAQPATPTPPPQQTAPPPTIPPVDDATPLPTPTPSPIPTPSGAPAPSIPAAETPTPTPQPSATRSPTPTRSAGPTGSASPTPLADEGDSSGGGSTLAAVLAIGAIVALIAAAVAGTVAWRKRRSPDIE